MILGLHGLWALRVFTVQGESLWVLTAAWRFNSCYGTVTSALITFGLLRPLIMLLGTMDGEAPA